MSLNLIEDLGVGSLRRVASFSKKGFHLLSVALKSGVEKYVIVQGPSSKIRNNSDYVLGRK